MTREDAINLKSFKNYCTCGGYAGMSERAKSRHPHMNWCKQYAEWEEWKAAIEKEQSK
jgi:hypothetical protein